MPDPVILTVRYTPPGAPESDSLHLELHTEPGARVSLRLTSPPRPPVPADPGPAPESRPAPAPQSAFPQPRGARAWDDPALPADCAPGLAPDLLTDAQANARILYGLARGWTQRRVGEFAGRSATTVNKIKKAHSE
ncbi:hypothetical protein ACFRR7_36720 [Streptomyces sp. NPDC056909]|uniref:hypothetical protein n=1 Tax=Streptomyces sp. NPDC056909 TaxID=3345963 RepID=UPI0036CEF295